ncbi:inverse autotransporter invasin YchO, partial [Escherichia coli]
IRQLHWQGDTQALSLTSPANGRSSDGWSVIMPAWDDSEGAKNRWRLSVVVEDERGQRVSSNEIALTVVQPLVALTNDDPRWTLLPDE